MDKILKIFDLQKKTKNDTLNLYFLQKLFEGDVLFMLKKKILMLILSAPLLFSIVPHAKAETFSNPQSITLNGKFIKDDSSSSGDTHENVLEALKVTPRADSFITYSSFIPNTLGFRYTGYDYRFQRFNNFSVKIPKTVRYVYTWGYSVSDTARTAWSLDSGVRLQGGTKLFTEIEGHINHNYQKEETVTVASDAKSEIGTLQPGIYEFEWFIKGDSYTINNKWNGYTVDQPDKKKVLDREIGSMTLPTKFLHLDIKHTPLP